MHVLLEESERRVLLMRADEAEPLFRVFSAVAREQGWDVQGELAADSDHAVIFAAECDRELVGGIKLVLGNPDGLPITRVWPEMSLVGRVDVADLALLAFRQGCRGSIEALWSVCVEMWRYCVEQDIHEVWAELPPRNLRLYRRIGWPFQVMGELRSHWGEPCLPCMMMVSAARSVVEARADSSGLLRDVLRQALREERAS